MTPQTATAPALPPAAAGLTTAEAARRLAEAGPNATTETTAPVWRRVLGKFWAPVPWMLEAAIVLQLVLGERVEAAVIAGLVVFNAGLAFVQESRAQATLDALKSRLALSAQVLRDGAWTSLPVAGLVAGDVVKLSLGGVVGADVTLLQGEVLLDQSTLTGESLPVEAGPGAQTFAGALVRRGEAVAEVTATGPRTRFGRTAELVRTAHAVSGQQRAVLGVVRNLAVFNGLVVVLQVAYALWLRLPAAEIVPLALTAILAAVPVALPATFTLAGAIGARALAARGVLPTRLSAVDEAATMDVLCADKTGTLTENALAVAQVAAMPGADEAQVLALAALASSDGGQDPVDAAIRAAAVKAASAPGAAIRPALERFVPFDPAAKMSEAVATWPDGRRVRIVKGAFARIAELARAPAEAPAAAEALERGGRRVLAVAAGPADALEIVGLIALSDPPRADAARLVGTLAGMGVRTVMVTGDAPATAGAVARAVGLQGEVCPPGVDPRSVRPGDYGVFAGVFPEDKFRIVQAFQAAGHTVGMCGDGANDAPALRQAQIGVAVSTATDVAKSAAGLVLTRPGLEGVVFAVREGRVTFQRILTYTLRSMTGKIDQMLFLTVGLFMTGHAVLSPMLMVLLMITGDFLAMASTTDRVRPSARPNAWRVGALTVAGISLGATNLAFCSSVLAAGAFWLRLAPAALQTLSAVTLVFSGQAVLYVVRERRRIWSSRPSAWFMAASAADLSIIAVLAVRGVLMTPLPAGLVAAVLVLTLAFAFVLDTVKAAVFRRLGMV